MVGWLTSKVFDVFAVVEHRVAAIRTQRRWRHLQSLGMHIGKNVVLPRSTWIDVAHCYLISIGDGCHFGPQCLILSHDAQMDEFLDAGRLGRVTIGEGCRIGARCVVLCNVEIGAGSIVEVGSVVATSLPADVYCAGSPARVVCSVAEYGERLAKDARGGPRYTVDAIGKRARDPEKRDELREELAKGAVVVHAARVSSARPSDDLPLTP